MRKWTTDGRIESDTRLWALTRWCWRHAPRAIAALVFRLNRIAM